MAFIKVFPQLHYIKLPFKRNVSPFLRRYTRSRSLKILNIGRIPALDHPEALAFFHGSLCYPDVQITVDGITTDSDDAEKDEDWSAVFQLFKCIAYARE